MSKAALESTLLDALEQQGFTEQELLDFCGALALAAGMEETNASDVALALSAAVDNVAKQALYPVIWLEGAACSGCTESFAQLSPPGIATVILELISLNYSDMLAAGAGSAVETAKTHTIEEGNYLLVYEGAVPLGWAGNALRVAGEAGTTPLLEAAASAQAVVALGSCAVNGGWLAAPPNPAQATGVQTYLRESEIAVPVIEIPGCPANPEWLMTVLIHLLLLGGLDTLTFDEAGRPKELFGDSVHDNCARRGCFEKGQFAFEFGSQEAKDGYCLYPLGCRGPQTKALCPITLWNNRRSWCVYAGSPCIGCCDSTPSSISWFERNASVNGRDRKVIPLKLSFIDFSGLPVIKDVIGFGMKEDS